MVTDNVGDVGHHRNLLAEIPEMVLLRKDAGLTTGPNIQTAQRPSLKLRRRRERARRHRVTTGGTNKHGSYSAV